jgi:type II secretory pathway pseudopilin PulG
MRRLGLMGSIRRSRGFLLLELGAVIALSTMLVIWQAPEQVRAVEDAGMDAVGVYMQVLNNAVDQYALANHNALASGTPVPGFANAMAPTIPELKAAHYIPNPTFPTTITRQNIPVAVKIIPQNCPGPNCQLFGVSYATQPLTLNSPNVRWDLVARYLQAAGGSGAASQYKNPSNLVSAVFNVPNPNGPVGGTIAIGTYLDQGLYDRFVQIKDTRDPDLQGNLTVAGNVKIGGPTTINNSLSTTGPVSVNNCVTLNPNGQAGFNCLNPGDIPAGYSGGVRAQDVVSSGNILSSDVPSAFNGSNGNYALMSDNSGGQAVIQTSGKVQGDRLIPTGAYIPGSACAEKGAVGLSTAAASGGVLVVCSGSQWTSLSTVASPGGPCPINGAGAVDGTGAQLYCLNNKWTPMTSIITTASAYSACTEPGSIGYDVATPVTSTSQSEAMICRANPADSTMTLRWFPLQDLTTNLMFFDSYGVNDGQVVAKPSCPVNPNAASVGGAPILVPQLIPQTETSTNGGFSRYVIDNGPSWTVYLKNGSGGSLNGPGGVAGAVLQVFCYYP